METETAVVTFRMRKITKLAIRRIVAKVKAAAPELTGLTIDIVMEAAVRVAERYIDEVVIEARGIAAESAASKREAA